MKQETFVGQPPFDTFGERPSLWARLVPEPLRAHGFRIGLIVYVIIVLAVGLVVNWRLFSERAALQDQVARDEQSLLTLPTVRRQIAEERSRQATLNRERDLLFTTVPDMTSIPLMADQLEQLGALAGGRVTRVDYTPPRWENNRGDVAMNVEMEGSFMNVLTYVAGLVESFPTARVRAMTMDVPSQSQGAQLRTSLVLSVGAFKDREDGVPLWDENSLRAGEAELVTSPFEPPVRAWLVGNQLGLDLPDWILTGVVQIDGATAALVRVNNRPLVVKVGDVVNDVTVVAILDKSIRVRMDGREAILPLGGR